MLGTTGFFEILVILAVALLVLGPRQLFVLIRQTGLILRKIRILYTRVTDEIDRQVRLDEMLNSGQTKPKSKQTGKKNVATNKKKTPGA